MGIDKVRAACESAKQNPAEENSFRQLRLNQWVKQAVRWPMERWDKRAFAANEDALEGRVCYGGLDLSSTTDITAFVLVSPPTKELMKLVLEEKIAHGGHPVLRWMMDNIYYIRTDPAGNIKPGKEKSTEKIDGAVATAMALNRAIRCGNDTSESVYDKRALLLI